MLRNQTYHRRPGVHILTPLLLSDGQGAVLVDRGWIPYTEASPEARRIYQEAAPARIEGFVRLTQPRQSNLAPADRPAPGANRIDAWFRVDLDAIQQQLPYPLAPFWVAQTAPPSQDALPLRHELPTIDEGSHLSYAMQWWSFATILLVGYVVSAVRETRKG